MNYEFIIVNNIPKPKLSNLKTKGEKPDYSIVLNYSKIVLNYIKNIIVSLNRLKNRPFLQ